MRCNTHPWRPTANLIYSYVAHSTTWISSANKGDVFWRGGIGLSELGKGYIYGSIKFYTPPLVYFISLCQLSQQGTGFKWVKRDIFMTTKLSETPPPPRSVEPTGGGGGGELAGERGIFMAAQKLYTPSQAHSIPLQGGQLSQKGKMVESAKGEGYVYDRINFYTSILWLTRPPFQISWTNGEGGIKFILQLWRNYLSWPNSAASLVNRGINSFHASPKNLHNCFLMYLGGELKILLSQSLSVNTNALFSTRYWILLSYHEW